MVKCRGTDKLATVRSQATDLSLINRCNLSWTRLPSKLFRDNILLIFSYGRSGNTGGNGIAPFLNVDMLQMKVAIGKSMKSFVNRSKLLMAVICNE